MTTQTTNTAIVIGGRTFAVTVTIEEKETLIRIPGISQALNNALAIDVRECCINEPNSVVGSACLHLIRRIDSTIKDAEQAGNPLETDMRVLFMQTTARQCSIWLNG